MRTFFLFIAYVMISSAYSQGTLPTQGDYDILKQNYGNQFKIIKTKYDDNNPSHLKLHFFTDKEDLDDSKVYEFTLRLKRKRYFENSKFKYVGLSVLTVPLKVRPGVEGVPSTMEAGLSNAGIQIGPKHTWDRYYSNGKTITQQINYGFLVAPASIALNTVNTKGAVTESINQFAMSLGLSFTYSYNGISFAVVPIGIDFGFSEEIREDWVYNGRQWLGFGIGIDPKSLFGSKSSK